MPRNPVSIFNYTDVSVFLSDIFTQKKLDRPHYSIRAWSRALNAGHVTSLARILNGQGKIPKGMVSSLGQYLQLNPQERAYFEILALGKQKLDPEVLDTIRQSLRVFS